MNYRDLINREFERRRIKNPGYSLRAFSRDLEISPACLSRVLADKQELSVTNAEKVAKGLALEEDERRYFFYLVQSKHPRSKNIRTHAQEALKNQVIRTAQLSLDEYQAISDWYYSAIIEMTRIKGFKSDVKWIAERLGLEPNLVREAIQRLIQINALKKDKNGNWVQVSDFRLSPQGSPNRALKEHHHQILKKAERAIDSQTYEERIFGSATLSVNTKDLPWIAKEIAEFRRELVKKIAKCSGRNRVYEFSMQFFALDQLEFAKK